MFTRLSSFLVALTTMVVLMEGTPCFAAPDVGHLAAAVVAQADAKAEEAPHEQGESGMMWFLRCSGLIGLFILGLSIYFVSLLVRLFMDLRIDVHVPQDIVGRCQDLIRERDFQGAYDLARQSDSVFGRLVSTGIAELPNGLADAREAMDRAGDAETVEMEKKISMLAVLGTLGPMIGLVGTLKGMIASFSVIAMSGVTLKASEVATGISEALLLTFEGVSLSVPAIYFYALFRNRVSSISVGAMLEADHVLRFFARTGRGKGAAGAAATAAAAGTPARTRTAAEG